MPQPFDLSTSGSCLLSVDDQHFTLAAGLLGDPVADLASRFDAVGRDEGVARRAVCITIDVDDRNAGGLRGFNGHGRRGGAGGNVDQRVDVLRKKILDLITW